ncbi:MAG: L-rhamnose 1-epimerase [Glaciihabitans sp.]|nr:L-rhamnose 1-epimerase [Glaciihabitans sp.]
MQRIASVIGIAPENVVEYERLHADVWPMVLARLAASHIGNYSIYRHNDLLFSYMEYTGDDLDADMAAIAADPETQRWWAICEPLQVALEGRAEGEWWQTLPEVFHFD